MELIVFAIRRIFVQLDPLRLREIQLLLQPDVEQTGKVLAPARPDSWRTLLRNLYKLNVVLTVQWGTSWKLLIPEVAPLRKAVLITEIGIHYERIAYFMDLRHSVDRDWIICTVLLRMG